MTKVVMVDLETLGTVADAAIVSIGAVSFTKESPVFSVDQELYTIPQLHFQNRSICPDTLAWWMKQSDAARACFSASNCVSLVEALGALCTFCSGAGEVWSKGADFDIAILQHAFKQLHLPNMQTPWSYKATRCFRTMEALYPEIPRPEFKGEQHNALADAKYQAEHLFNILVRHNSGKVL